MLSTKLTLSDWATENQIKLSNKCGMTVTRLGDF